MSKDIWNLLQILLLACGFNHHESNRRMVYSPWRKGEKPNGCAIMATWRNYVCNRISIWLDKRCIFAGVGIGANARAALFSRLTSLFGFLL
jgi:hypothetical protein